jgi:hypothetical protein
MRWFLHPESREQYVDWEADASVCVAMLQGACVARPHDRQLRQHVEGARRDSTVESLWSSSNREIMERYGGYVLRMVLPDPDGEVTELVTHVFEPGGLPGCRMTVLTRRAIDGPQPEVPATCLGEKP